MEEFKGTKWSVEERFDEERMQNVFEIDNDFEEGAITVWTSLDEKKSLQRANLICEAFNVVTRTGLTPEQMEKRISDLEDRLKEATIAITALLEENTEHELNLNGVELGEAFLTKEKTK